MFLDMNDTDRSVRGLREIIRQLLQEHDLDRFNSVEADARDDGHNVATSIATAIDALAEKKYCPLGTQEELHKEIKGLRKTCNMTVAEYATKFEDLVSLERWILPDDGTRMGPAEQCRYFNAGMPRQWQMQVVPQQVRWTDRLWLQDRYAVRASRPADPGGKAKESQEKDGGKDAKE
ncbi:unnamed protein product [Phytophthora fragariaefolia]|uniref:Unnamed protein product n=1 Tax=Phytophthora fragariaefolia TaxID=1490495 RepID=A0A9W7DCK0_9STRA|nr:unnamed protein product [Phytophthora fragariaefolia]